PRARCAGRTSPAPAPPAAATCADTAGPREARDGAGRAAGAVHRGPSSAVTADTCGTPAHPVPLLLVPAAAAGLPAALVSGAARAGPGARTHRGRSAPPRLARADPALGRDPAHHRDPGRGDRDVALGHAAPRHDRFAGSRPHA